MRPVQVERVLTSYKDATGNVVVIHKKKHDRSFYKIVLPVEAILQQYKTYGLKNFVNLDSLRSNYEGIFTIDNIKDQTGKERMILLRKEMPMRDTTGLSYEICRDQHLVALYTGEMDIPLLTRDRYNTFEYKKGKPVSFIYMPNRKAGSPSATDETYYITYEFCRPRLNIRYALVPFTAAFDVASIPVFIAGGILFTLVSVVM